MRYPPHPLLRYRDLRVPRASSRLASIAEAREIVYLYNARSALFHLFRHLTSNRRRRVLMPAFHCVSMVEPALHAGLDVSYYRIDRRLRIDHDEVLARAGSDVAAFVFVNFFGFPAAVETLLEELRRRNIATIEDCSHSFLTPKPFGLTGGRGDFSVYSFAKLIPSAIGGGLRDSQARFAVPQLSRPPLRDSIVVTKRLLEQTILSADDRLWLKSLYLALESARMRIWQRPATPPATERDLTHVVRPAAAVAFGALAFDPVQARTSFGGLPHCILQIADLREISDRRRSNYQLYASQLANVDAPLSLLPHLDEGVCPWAYPVLLSDRSSHDVRLRSLGVPVWTFGDQLHPSLDHASFPGAAADARHLAAHLLCLPVHQGLPPEAVEQFARTVANAGLPAPPMQ